MTSNFSIAVVQVKHLNEFMIKMKKSGYSESYRIQILDSAEKAFEKMVKNDQMGIKPLYRDNNWNKNEQALGKQ